MHTGWPCRPLLAAAAGECYLVLLLCAATMGLLLPPQAHRAMDAPRAAAAPAAPPLLPRPPPQQQQRFRGSSNSRSQSLQPKPSGRGCTHDEGVARAGEGQRAVRKVTIEVNPLAALQVDRAERLPCATIQAERASVRPRGVKEDGPTGHRLGEDRQSTRSGGSGAGHAGGE